MGNISKMPDLNGFFSVLECKNYKSRSHGKRKNGNIKRKICTEKRLNTSLKDLSIALINHAGKGLTSWLSFVVSSVSLALSHWYPWSGVVLDCIDS